MTGRLGDVVTDPVLVRCEGCGQSLILCQTCCDHDGVRCCGVCTHHPDSLLPYMVEA